MPSEHRAPNIDHALQAYAELLLRWNKRINLIAESTEQAIRTRHIEDSAQLFDYLPKDAETAIDLGSGAGFPGLVLACVSQNAGRATGFHLIESDQRKAAFLQEAARVMELNNVTVHTTRVEELSMKAEAITARAFAPLDALFRMSAPLVQKEHLFLLLKGCKASEEMESARNAGWEFTARTHPSRTSPDGIILEIRDVVRP